MADQVTEVTSQSWFSRIKNSVGGMILGLILTVLPFFGLTWNEKRAITRTRALNEGAKQVISVSSEAVDSANEGALVHLQGRAESSDPVEDPVFGLSEQALKLRRIVDVYQWRESKSEETETKLGGGTETVTTYSYDRVWEDDLIDSASFRESAGHRNPAEKRFPNFTDVADPIQVGAYELPEVLVSRLTGWRTREAPPLETLPDAVRSQAKAAGERLYYGEDPGNPMVGDHRIRFETIPPHDVTVVATQVGTTLEPFLSKSGARVALLEAGVHSASAMFSRAHAENRVLTWILRGVFFLVMGIGLSLLLRPLSVLADVIPALGRVVGAGTGFIAFLLAATLSSFTIAIAWIAFRPAIGVPLLILAAGLTVWIVVRVNRAERPPPLPTG